MGASMSGWVNGHPRMTSVTALLRVVSGLRVRLLALILLAVIPLLALIFYTDGAWRSHDVRDTNRYALGLARLAAAHHAQMVQGARDLLVSVTQVPEMRQVDSMGCERVLAAFRGSFPKYANFGIVQADGSVSCSAVPAHGSINLGDRLFFRRVLETRGFVAGDVAIGRIVGKATMHFAAPILDATDRIQAVVFAGLDLDWLDTHLTLADLPANATVTLMDHTGVILARAPDGSQWVGQSALTAPVVRAIVDGKREGTAIAQDLDGVEKLLAFAPLRGSSVDGGLYVAVAIPLTEAFSEADQLLKRSLGILGGVSLLVVLVTWVGSDAFVLRQVRAMLGMTQRLSRGDLTARSGGASGSGELAELARAFDHMAAELEKRHAEARGAEEALRKANDDLEKRVQERTAHLVVANEAQQVALRDLKRAQDHLEEQQAQLAGIIETAMEAIITIDEDDRVIVFNREAERIFRIPASEAIGRPVDRFVPERFRAAHREGLRLLRHHGVVEKKIGLARSAVAIRADGEEFSIEAAVSEVEIRGERLHTIVLRDISERLRTEEMLRKLSLAVEQTTESVFITNREGLIEYVNPAFEKLTGYRREEAIGRTPRILKSGEHDAAFYGKLWTTILSGQVYSCVFLNRKKSGERYYEEQTIAPIRDDGRQITHFVAAGRDVTERKRTEEALRRLNAQLEREAERIAHTLHDEAGPLLTSAHITLADVARDLPPSAQERLSGVRAHLDGIEQHLRRLSHELRPRILDDLGLEAAVEFLVEGFMKRTGVAVTVETNLDGRLPQIVETTMYRVVQEGLTNAARHARPTRIGVQIAHDGKTIRCAIRDNGAGFKVEEVFGHRGEASLGLVGTGDRVEALGGTFAVASVPGEGTEVLVVLPADFTEL